MHRLRAIILLLVSCTGYAAEHAAPACQQPPVTRISSLQALTVETLRARSYHSQLRLLKTLGSPRLASDYSAHYTPPDATAASTFMLGYSSDGLALYSRLDIPATPAPANGYPLLVFAPGWISLEESPGYDFGYNTESFYGELISGFVNRGFAVLTAGYRGRGTVDGKAADGIEFTRTWGNGSYLSPIFYSLDVLNLIAGLDGLGALPWREYGYPDTSTPGFDLQRVSLLGHSQGGDVGLNVLAVVGNNRQYPQALAAASIWSGNIADRFSQADTFGAMASSLQAFMSGDGSWTGSATGRDGSVNPDFIFPWPADWIGTLDTHSPDWSWQAQTWSVASVEAARAQKYDEMYQTLNRCVEDLDGVHYQFARNEDGASVVQHAPRIAELMPRIGGYFYHQYLTMPLALHISDRDYYSLPAWNEDLAARINNSGGQARVYLYAGTTHSLKVSPQAWFSPAGTEAGVERAMALDSRLFKDGNLTR